MDPERTIEEILAIIQRGAISAASSGNINLVGHVLAPFAALLVKLSRDSADVMARVERLTRNLFATIIALLIVSASQEGSFTRRRLDGRHLRAIKKRVWGQR
jgi:hypothetical protein